MKILYGIQGTGHGHVSRAKELLPELTRHARVDVLISGYACKLLPRQTITYRKHGISLIYDHSGGVSVSATLRRLKPFQFLKDLWSVSLSQYDLVISDYEPVTAWAAWLEGMPSLALSHQAAFLSTKAPRPPRVSVGAEQLLRYFAPARRAVGFHYRSYDHFIKPPLIRSDIRRLKPVDHGHISVYLPAFHSAFLCRIFSRISTVEWHLFAPDCCVPWRQGNVHLFPVGDDAFVQSFKSCSGVITGAGFEMCAEAMYLQKKLLAIPIRKQYEQWCNAAALGELGVKILPGLQGHEADIRQWLARHTAVGLPAIVHPGRLVEEILSE